MTKRIISSIMVLLLFISPFNNAIAENWGTSPAVPHTLQFRSDGKYNGFSSFIGPGRGGMFSEDGTYYNRDVSYIRGLWRETFDGSVYIYIEFRATPNYYRRVYVTNTYFSNVGHLPIVQLTGKPAIVTQDCSALFGPGQEYNKLERSYVPAGTKATVYFEEKGYVLADFINDNGSVRAYLPSNCVASEGNGTNNSVNNASSNVYCVQCGYQKPAGSDYKYCPNCGTAFTR